VLFGNQGKSARCIVMCSPREMYVCSEYVFLICCHCKYTSQSATAGVLVMIIVLTARHSKCTTRFTAPL